MDEQNNPQNSETQQSLQQTASTAKNIGQKIGQVVTKVVKAIGKALKRVGQAIMKLAKNPLFWKIFFIVLLVLLGIVLIVAVVAAIASLFEFDSYDKENGTISAPYGISGEAFYGARYIYEDKVAASIELEDYYLKLSYEILDDIDNTSGLVTYTLSADYKTDESTAILAKSLANAMAETADLSITDATLNIDHYGFTEEEWALISSSAKETIAYHWLEIGKGSTDVEDALNSVLSTADYDKYENLYSTYFVWDYILENDDSTLDDIPKKNFVGYIYMPKQAVKLTSISYVFIVDGGYGAEVQIKHKNNSEQINQIGETQTALVDWYYDDELHEYIEYENIDVSLSKFEAINESNINALSTPTSLYDLIEDGSYSTYFNSTNNDYSAQALLENVKTSNYYYLQIASFDPYNFADYHIEYDV